MKKLFLAFLIFVQYGITTAQRYNIKDKYGYTTGYIQVNNTNPKSVGIYDKYGYLINTIEYEDAKSYFPELTYRKDPLAEEISTNYKEQSNSAWGIKESTSGGFNPEMEEGIDPYNSRFDEYVKEFNELVSNAKEFLKYGIDIRISNSYPEINAAHLEWQSRWNANFKLGKMIKKQ